MINTHKISLKLICAVLEKNYKGNTFMKQNFGKGCMILI